MAIVWIDGFDYYTSYTDRYIPTNGYPGEAVITAGVGRFGSSALGFGASMARGSIGPAIAIPSSGTYTAGMAMKPYGSVGGAPFSLTESGTVHVDLRWSGYYLTITRNGTLLATSTVPLQADTWAYVELGVVIHSSTGSAELRINGVTTATFSGNTRNGGTGVINGFAIGGISPVTNRCYVDDLYLRNDGVFTGDTRVEYLVPTGAGVRTQFTPSTGSNWSTVDEAPGSDTDYNSANTPGAMDLFQMANLSGNGLVHAVQVTSRAKKDDAGFRKFKPVFYKATGLGDTNRWYTGTQVPVSDTFSNLPIQLSVTSPDTGAAWTVDEINAIQYGYAVGDAGMFTIDARLV